MNLSCSRGSLVASLFTNKEQKKGKKLADDVFQELLPDVLDAGLVHVVHDTDF